MSCDNVELNITENNQAVNVSVIESNDIVKISIQEEGNTEINISSIDESIKIVLEEVVEEIQINFQDIFLKEIIIIEAANVLKVVAGEVLGGQRVVMLENGVAFYYDPSDEKNVGKVIGITNQASIQGEQIDIVGFGVITNMGNLIPNQIYYAGLNGLISETPIASGIFQRIGIAIDANNLKIDFSEPLIIT